MLDIIENDFPEKSILITGCPGSGKTSVSIHRFMHQTLRPNPRRVQLLTFQKLLNVAIINTLKAQGITSPRVATLCKWYSRHTGGQYFYMQGNDASPSAEEIRRCLEPALATAPLDELIIDEGQDVHRKGFDSLPALCTKITIGGDGAQTVNRKGVGDVDEIETALQAFGDIRYCPLEYIYRTSFVAYEFARQFVPDVPSANEPAVLQILRDYRPGDDDDKPRVFTYSDETQMKARIATILDDALPNSEQGIVAILVPTKEDVTRFAKLVGSIIRNGKPVQYSIYHSASGDAPSTVHQVLVTTFVSAKGMEFETVIIPMLPSQMDRPAVNTSEQSRNWRCQCFVACTRAIRRLYIFCHGNLHPLLASPDFAPASFVLRHLEPKPPQHIN
jgi:DNA helicase IV